MRRYTLNAPFNLKGKKVIITGAAGVLGSWITKAFEESGACLWLVDLNLEHLKMKASQLSLTNEIITSSVDLRNEEEIENFFECVAERWGAPDFLINNAGLYPSSYMLDLSSAMWDEVMNVNMKAPFLMTKYFSNLLIKEGKGGSVVNITSKSSKTPRIGAVHYAASKSALEMMTRGYSMELAKYNIRVNAVSPGFAPGSEKNILSEEYIKAMSRKIPLGRTSGPNDAPQAVLFLCSEKSSFITGSSIFVDGGNTAGDFEIPVAGDQKGVASQ
jgi:3-oxoacyl-[acyl-carrier protein] reductase